jgi:ferredoxin-fold anticodon binding domain-containing protein
VVGNVIILEDSDNEKVIKLVQSSTRVLMTSFRNKAEELHKCSDDIKKLIRAGYNTEIVKEAARKLFGNDKGISLLAIDGTESHDQQLDMLVFYAGAFGYIAELDFGDNGCYNRYIARMQS